MDEIHRLMSQGATDEFIMNGRRDDQDRPIIMPRARFYRRKKKLIEQMTEMWRAKREEDYAKEIQFCKERLTRQMVNAYSHASQQNANAFWGAIAADLTVSILKLEVEGILAIKNGRFRQLEEKAGYVQYDGPRATLPDSSIDGLATTETTTTRTEDPNRVA